MVANISKASVKYPNLLDAGVLRSSEFFRISKYETFGELSIGSSHPSLPSSDFTRDLREARQMFSFICDRHKAKSLQNILFSRPFGVSNSQLSACNFQPLSLSCSHTTTSPLQQLLPLSYQPLVHTRSTHVLPFLLMRMRVKFTTYFRHFRETG